MSCKEKDMTAWVFSNQGDIQARCENLQKVFGKKLVYVDIDGKLAIYSEDNEVMNRLDELMYVLAIKGVERRVISIKNEFP